jgi:hypothetical protein
MQMNLFIDASALIKRLLTPNPTKRATIIDICTDCWVNRGYEHSLLQVAEDMANLTPVRLDILLALAPVSPSTEQNTKNPFDDKNKDSNDENIDNLNESADDKSSSNVSILDNNLKKRQASSSFDQSLSKFPVPTQTQTPRKKKTKKSQNDSSTSKVIAEKPLEETKEIEKTRNEVSSDMTSNIDNQNDENSIIENKESVEFAETKQIDDIPIDVPSDQNVENIEISNTQIDSLGKGPAEDISTPSKPPEMLAEMDILTDSGNQLSLDLKPIETQVEAKEIDETLNDVEKENEGNLLIENQIKLSKESFQTKEPEIESTNEIEKTSPVEESQETKDESNEIQNEDKKKIKVNRNGSSKRPGRLSIPKLWDETPEATNETCSPSAKSSDNKLITQIKDTKKLIETKPEKKVPFIPVGFRVSDAKRQYERRCSVPANSSLQITSSYSKRRESKPSIDSKEVDDTKVRPNAPKLSTRSLSLSEMLESPKRVQEINNSIKAINESNKIDETSETTSQTQNDGQIERISPQTSSQKEINENKSVTTPSSDTIDKKNLAKDILKKSIAKAKLMEKRQNSHSGSNSPVTTPLVSIENSDVLITQEPSVFRTPRPYVKEETAKPSIQTPIEIKVNPNISQQIDENISKQSDPKIIKSVNEKGVLSEVPQNIMEDESGEKMDSPQQTKAMPIARSYKKVTFTKEGACITETGKIYSSEGADGSYTRVEKKSKVTHFPSIEDEMQTLPNSSNANIDNKFNLQKSDSHSSSGSTDIFDDIFDDHWCGDSIFPNMKSLLHSVIGNKKERKTRRRSRAESCERNSSDWFPSGYSSRKNNSNLTDHESDNDDYESSFSSFGQKSIWPTTRSIFDRPSVFSKHFSGELDKDFGGLDDSIHPFHEFSRSLSKDRSSFSSRIHPTSFKVVFGTQPSVRTRERDNLETDDAYASASRTSNKFETSPKSKFGDYSRTRSREHDSIFSEKEPNSLQKHDSYDASRKRVEQWLHSDNNEENEELERKVPFSMYGTVGPRGFRRYLRTISGRQNNDKQSSEYPNVSVNSSIFHTSSDSRSSRPQQTNPIYPSTASTVPNDSVIEMRFTLNPTSADNNKTILNSSTNLSDLNTISISNCQTSQTSEPSECSDDHQNSIVLPESSSLLEQLRTHGYRNIVTQRLSGSSLFSDLDTNLTENDTNYKRGKRVLNSSSSVLNENANACECMDTTNPMATTNGCAHYNASKASESMTTATQVEFADSRLQSNTEIVNKSLKHTVNQQSCEPTSRITTHTARSNTTGDLPECNHPLKQTNNNVNLKESVQERIHRKSFYSRFNDIRPALTSRQRRRSFIDPEDVDSAILRLRKSSNLSSNSFRNSLSLDNYSFVSSKPSFTSSDWFNRMESRASQLMDDLLENDRVSAFREQLRNRDSSEQSYSYHNRRRSSSSTRSPFSTPRSHKSDFDSFPNSYLNRLSNNEDNDNEETHSTDFNNLLDDMTSPTEVLRRAIDVLSQKIN